MIINVVHPEGTEIFEDGGKKASVQIKGSVSVLSVSSIEEEYVIELGQVPSLVIQDSEGTVWIFENTKYKDLYPEKELVSWKI